MASKKANKPVTPPASRPEVQPLWKEKVCYVTRYISQYGILGFMFDGVPCQMSVAKDLPIINGSTVTIHYQGDIQTGLKFKL